MLIAAIFTPAGNENRQIRPEQAADFRKRGFTIYESPYRPGLYTAQSTFEESARRLPANP